MSGKYIIEELKPKIDLAWFTPEGWEEDMPAKVLVVVPPTLLVQMFGVPEAVKLPSRVGDSIDFKAHGKVWHCKRVRRDAYFLAAFKQTERGSRARWGRAAEIAADIGHILETGALPRADGASW